MEEAVEKKTLAQARLRARIKMENPRKNAKGIAKYANLEAVLDSVIPALLDEGIEMTQWMVTQEDKHFLITELCLAETGECRQWAFPMMIQKSDIHGVGSAISYFRRYSVMAIFSLASEDDDGKKALPNQDESKSPPQEKPSETDILRGYKQTVARQIRAMGVSDAKGNEILRFLNGRAAESGFPLKYWEWLAQNPSATQQEIRNMDENGG